MATDTDLVRGETKSFVVLCTSDKVPDGRVLANG